MARPKLKAVEADDGSYAGAVLAAYDLLAATEPDYAAERLLPEGRTCRDCSHGPRCDALFGAVRQGFTSCDFWPSLFILSGNR